VENSIKSHHSTALSGAELSIVMLTLAVGFALPCAASEEMTFRKTADEYAVYLTVMPAEFISGPRPAPEPGAIPYQPPAAKDTHHVMVSVFDYRTGRRVTNAAVAARVARLGFSGEKKVLAPIAVVGAAVFANSFPMIGRGPFRIDVEFRVPDAQRHEHTTFYFTHPSFAPPKRENQKRGTP